MLDERERAPIARILEGPFIVDIELAVCGSEKAVEHPLGLFRREKDLFVTRNFSSVLFRESIGNRPANCR